MSVLDEGTVRELVEGVERAEQAWRKDFDPYDPLNPGNTARFSTYTNARDALFRSAPDLAATVLDLYDRLRVIAEREDALRHDR